MDVYLYFVEVYKYINVYLSRWIYHSPYKPENINFKSYFDTSLFDKVL